MITYLFHTRPSAPLLLFRLLQYGQTVRGNRLCQPYFVTCIIKGYTPDCRFNRIHSEQHKLTSPAAGQTGKMQPLRQMDILSAHRL
ncbi:hypothetical protein D3C73_1380760 [compost metagenome]